MKQIPLSQGKVALIDDEDYPLVSKHRWWFDRYAYMQTHKAGKVTTVRMHRLITGALKGNEVDHINGDKLDNRRSNLRLCTPSQNKANIGLKRNNTTGLRGVTWAKRENRWHAHIEHDRKQYNLGYFDTASEAALAYNVKARQFWGEFAYQNAV